jgi:hypothetical protein
MLRRGFPCKKNQTKAAHYWKLAADQGDVQAQMTYANCLLHGDGVNVDMIESQKYFELACSRGGSSVKLRYGIVLLSGLLGRFGFEQARNLFGQAMSSNRFARILHSALSGSDNHLATSDEYSDLGNVFSLIRSPGDDKFAMIRLMNVHLCDTSRGDTRVVEVWKKMAELSINYLLDLSQINSAVLRSLPIELGQCQSIPDMIPLIFRMYSIQSQLYKNVNCLLRNFPIQILGKFMKELRGILSYIYLLQSSIDYLSHNQPISRNRVVYRGIPSGGCELASLYDSMIDQVVVWPGFTSTSKNRECVIRQFVRNDDGILFKIILHSGSVAADIQSSSEFPYESEILIAASSAFRILEVTNIKFPNSSVPNSPVRVIPKVKLSYEMLWTEFNIDNPPPPLLI